MVHLSEVSDTVRRIAVISDVHGNSPALEAVLVEAMRSDPDVL
jgi:predicted phosphodiesterase